MGHFYEHGRRRNVAIERKGTVQATSIFRLFYRFKYAILASWIEQPCHRVLSIIFNVSIFPLPDWLDLKYDALNTNDVSRCTTKLYAKYHHRIQSLKTWIKIIAACYVSEGNLNTSARCSLLRQRARSIAPFFRNVARSSPHSLYICGNAWLSSSATVKVNRVYSSGLRWPPPLWKLYFRMVGTKFGRRRWLDSHRCAYKRNGDLLSFIPLLLR